MDAVVAPVAAGAPAANVWCGRPLAAEVLSANVGLYSALGSGVFVLSVLVTFTAGPSLGARGRSLTGDCTEILDKRGTSLVGRTVAFGTLDRRDVNPGDGASAATR